jgi:hypothetical protein
MEQPVRLGAHFSLETGHFHCCGDLSGGKVEFPSGTGFAERLQVGKSVEQGWDTI